VILDGYSRHAIIAPGISVWFRPITSLERRFFRYTMQHLSSQTVISARYRFVSDHLVSSMNDIEEQWATVARFGVDRPTEFERLWRVVQGLLPDSRGRRWDEDEAVWKRNLAEGIQLKRTNQKLASRSCESCQEFWYSEETGDPILSNSTLLPMLRVSPPPCRMPGVGCPKGDPENQRTLNSANGLALSHYLNCAAVGIFPQDSIVSQNAKVIAKALSRPIKK
jgi:hypothetical protein